MVEKEKVKQEEQSWVQGISLNLAEHFMTLQNYQSSEYQPYLLYLEKRINISKRRLIKQTNKRRTNIKD